MMINRECKTRDCKMIWLENCFRLSNNALDDVKEVKALLGFKSSKMVELNKSRAIAAIDSAIESLKELRVLISSR